MKSSPGKRRAVFLDRDGVINASPKNRFVRRWDEFRFLPGVLKALKRLNDEGELCIVVSNQSGVGRKVMSNKALDEIHRRMVGAIARHGGRIQAVYACPHRPQDRCPCRKPGLGLIRQAVQRFSIDLPHSFVVGDSPKDLRMGRAAGCQTILVLSGKTDSQRASQLAIRPNRVLKDLAGAVGWILKKRRS